MRDGDQREVGRSGEVIEDVLFLELVDLVQHQHVRLLCGIPEAVGQFVTLYSYTAWWTGGPGSSIRPSRWTG